MTELEKLKIQAYDLLQRITEIEKEKQLLAQEYKDLNIKINQGKTTKEK